MELAQEKIQVLRHNERDIVFVEDDHFINREPAKEIMRLLMLDDSLKGVVIEYFDHELKENLRKSIFYRMVRLPLLGIPGLKKMYVRGRIFSFSWLTKLCKQHDKQVLVADLANKPSFMSVARIQEAAISTTSIWTLFCCLFVNPEQSFLTAQSLSVLGMMLGKIYDYFCASVIKNKKPSSMEKFLIDSEDARRIFVAKAIDKVSQEMGNNEYVTVVYPIAHIKRVIAYLQEYPELKAKIYGVLYPYLDFQLRKYRYEKDKYNPGWKLSDTADLVSLIGV